MGGRAEFEAALGFTLDDFQRRALDAIDAGQSVLVAAPTGSGKTIVAEYAVDRARALGGKVFYTTPLKALSNQKFADLRRVHGTATVGLLTGDNSINGDAPVVVMTTEVLRNMIYGASPALDGLRYVVLDEVHYLQDRYRGAVWEEVIVHLAPTVDLVCLSATVSNAEEFADWIATVRGATTAIIEERRPVALRNRYLVGERGVDTLHLLPTFVGDGDGEDLRPNPDAARLDRRQGRGGTRGATGRARSRLVAPGRVESLDRLADDAMLPAIVFVFSRKGCEQAVEQCRAARVRLTTRAERDTIRGIAERHLTDLAEDDLAVLGVDAWLDGLSAGIAAHHAGLVPPMKEAVEEAFAAGLVKVVYATETLALGINMPARSVMIEKLTKFTGERHEFLTPGEYTQLTGRAGRRGIDEVGYAVVCWNPYVTFDQAASLAARRTDALTSSFRPTYNMTVNLVHRYSAEDAHHLLNLSFAQYRADRDVVALERQLERSREQLARQLDRARSAAGDIDEYRTLVSRLDAARRGRGAASQVSAALERVRPGDIVWVGGRGGRVVVLAHDGRRGGHPRLLALTTGKSLVRVTADDFTAPPRPLGHIELPSPYAPKNPNFRRETAFRLRRAKVRDPARDKPSEVVGDLEAAVAAHPVAGDPARESRLRAAASVERLERDIARLERRVQGRSESLARQFDRVLGLLESWGYVDGWSLTPPGAILARLYTETDLLLAETIREGRLDGLTAAEVAAVVSCFTYERRGSDDASAPPLRWPTRRVAERARELESLWQTLVKAEDDARLPETRPPDPGFTPYLYEWVLGETLATVLDDEELAGGDFVRNVKQCIDLLRQVADVAPDPATRDAARAAADAAFRGVVAAASAVP
ncbi:MAG TPA: DEAD/DEAH box helicase [Acidimicrobiia bacterium]|nr:DEAD/DEAH box helicase [Acidimicrobiia bacterium]